MTTCPSCGVCIDRIGDGHDCYETPEPAPTRLVRLSETAVRMIVGALQVWQDNLRRDLPEYRKRVPQHAPTIETWIAEIDAARDELSNPV